MSRTDKDLPYWIADEYQEVHHWRCSVGLIECDVPDNPIEIRCFRRYTHCYWQPIHKRVWWQNPPPKWYIDHDWNNPQRVRVRDYAREATKEYNANGKLDSTFQNEQHRHRSTWYYW